MRRALMDTSGIYAFVARTDPEHTAALNFTKKWLARSGTFVLLDWVFIETMTLLKRKISTSVTLSIGRELRQNPLYQWTTLGPQGERETWAMFQKYDDKEWSYTDCGLLVMSRRLKVSEVFSFDEHFKQMPGITRLP